MKLSQFLLTIEELRALSVAFFHLFTFVSSRLHVAVCHGKHRRSGLHEELAHLHVVAGRSTVKRRPKVKIQKVNPNELERKGFHQIQALGNSPSITVSSVYVDAKLNKKLDDLGVAGTDGVVQSSDAFIIRLTGILNLF